MTGSVLVAAVLALLAAVAFAVATVVQQRAAALTSDEDARGFAFVRQVARRPMWWAGTGGAVFGYGLQAVALGVGSLLIVQPILVTSLLFALPFSARLAHRRLATGVWVWGGVLVVALGVFVSFATSTQGLAHASHRAWLIAGTVTTVVVVGCVVAAHPRSGAARASLLALASGLAEGVLAVLTKGVASTATDGLVAILSSAETYALIVVGLAGVYLQQLAFQAGSLQASMPIVVVLEPLTAVVFGLLLLHEHLDASGAGLALLGIAGVAMFVATVVLARDAAVAAEATAAAEARAG